MSFNSRQMNSQTHYHYNTADSVTEEMSLITIIHAGLLSLFKSAQINYCNHASLNTNTQAYKYKMIIHAHQFGRLILVKILKGLNDESLLILMYYERHMYRGIISANLSTMK